uniref:DUF4477 domain-containing protein n=1 Tax=Glossina brevipalpis TaxID=37001 RepID=A0A1A9WLI3_9MUSC
MHGFKDICKLNTALCRSLKVDFKNELDIFRASLPDVAYEDGTDIHMPARDCYDFLLLRLIAVHKLYERIQNCCAKAANYFLHGIKMYHFFEISTLIFAVLAKINDLTMRLGNLSTILYQRLLPFRKKLPCNIKSNGSPHSETAFVFPEKLEEFGEKNFDKQSCATLQDAHTNMKEKLNNLLREDSKMALVKAKCFKKTDVGVKVKRETKEVTASLNIEELTTAEAMRLFIMKEREQRSNNLTRCITKNIKPHEWLGAVKVFERKVRHGEINKGLKVFRTFLEAKIN